MAYPHVVSHPLWCLWPFSDLQFLEIINTRQAYIILRVVTVGYPECFPGVKSSSCSRVEHVVLDSDSARSAEPGHKLRDWVNIDVDVDTGGGVETEIEMSNTQRPTR